MKSRLTCRAAAILLTTLVAAPHLASAQGRTVQSECAIEAARDCPMRLLARRRLTDCRAEHPATLSDRCRAALTRSLADQRAGWRADVARRLCVIDIQRVCDKARPDRPDVMACLTGSRDRLSPRCLYGLDEARRLDQSYSAVSGSPTAPR